MPTYYQILGLKENASIREIKNNYRVLAKKYHPDMESGNSEEFIKIKEAYDILMCPIKKRRYDETLKKEREGVKKKSGLEASVRGGLNVVSKGVQVNYVKTKIIYRESPVIIKEMEIKYNNFGQNKK